MIIEVIAAVNHRVLVEASQNLRPYKALKAKDSARSGSQQERPLGLQPLQLMDMQSAVRDVTTTSVYWSR